MAHAQSDILIFPKNGTEEVNNLLFSFSICIIIMIEFSTRGTKDL